MEVSGMNHIIIKSLEYLRDKQLRIVMVEFNDDFCIVFTGDHVEGVYNTLVKVSGYEDIYSLIKESKNQIYSANSELEKIKSSFIYKIFHFFKLI